MRDPFDSAPFAEPIQETVSPRPSLASEAMHVLGAARSIESQARFARKTGNHVWLAKLGELACRLAVYAWKVFLGAAHIAALTLVTEICNRVLGNATDRLLKRKGTPAPTAQPTNYNDPFARQYNNSGMAW